MGQALLAEATEPWSAIIIQAILSIAGILAVMLPLWWLDHVKRRDRQKVIDQRHAAFVADSSNRSEKLDELLRLTNGITEAEHVPDGDGDGPTLGSVLRDVQRTVDDGFKRNDETHAQIASTVQAQGELLHDHGRRLDAQRSDIDRIFKRIESVLDDQPPDTLRSNDRP